MVGVRPYLLQRLEELLAQRPPEDQELVHFTESLATTVIEELTDPGDLVLDPFAGFGTTLVVAERLGRRAVGVELMPERVAQVRARLGPRARVVTGDARQLLALVPDAVAELGGGAVRLCLTSPPYRTRNDHPEDPLAAYEVDGGDYPGYLSDLADVAAQVRRLLRPDGHVVLNVANVVEAGVFTPLAWDVAPRGLLRAGAARRDVPVLGRDAPRHRQRPLPPLRHGPGGLSRRNGVGPGQCAWSVSPAAWWRTTRSATTATLMFISWETRDSIANAAASSMPCRDIRSPTALPISRLLCSPRRRVVASSPPLDGGQGHRGEGHHHGRLLQGVLVEGTDPVAEDVQGADLAAVATDPEAGHAADRGLGPDAHAEHRPPPTQERSGLTWWSGSSSSRASRHGPLAQLQLQALDLGGDVVGGGGGEDAVVAPEHQRGVVAAVDQGHRGGAEGLVHVVEGLAVVDDLGEPADGRDEVLGKRSGHGGVL